MPRPIYKSYFVSNGNRTARIEEYSDLLDAALINISKQSGEIVSVEHTQAGAYGQYWSTLFVYVVYEN